MILISSLKIKLFVAKKRSKVVNTMVYVT
jgi:hypothetical protein